MASKLSGKKGIGLEYFMSCILRYMCVGWELLLLLTDAELGSELMPESEEIELGDLLNSLGICMLILWLGGWLREEEETDLGLLLEEK